MTIVLAGGGSGGHITPLLAVAQELKHQKPDAKLVYVGEKDGKFADVAKGSQFIDQSYSVKAGKFRRYNSQSFLAHVFDIKTNLLNARDFFRVGVGYRQSLKLLKELKPELVFIKGGFVGVPVGRACAKLGIPYITHDSDTVPGLANRLIAKNALLHCVGMPKEFYSYPPEKTEVVGIPLANEYERVTPDLMKQYRNELKLPSNAQVVFVTGGSLGAERLNAYMSLVAQELLSQNPNLYILHQAGKGNLGLYSSLSKDLMQRVQLLEFVNNMFVYSGAADVVVSRAGASTIAELALQGKACILVPNPYLTGGHQLMNAKLLSDSGAVKVLHEDTLANDPDALVVAITGLINDKTAQSKLSSKLHEFAHPNAAHDLAKIILETIDFVKDQMKK